MAWVHLAAAWLLLLLLYADSDGFVLLLQLYYYCVTAVMTAVWLHPFMVLLPDVISIDVLMIIVIIVDAHWHWEKVI